MRLAGRKAVVTGAAKGISGAITRGLAGEGADLLLVGRDTAALEAVAAEVRALGRDAHVARADVSQEADVSEMAKTAAAVFGGRVDILVNVAGVTGAIETPVHQHSVEDFDWVYAVNVRGTFLCIKHILPLMIPHRYGKIVNISGTSGLRGYKYRAGYSASKWAVRGLTRTVAIEVGPHNINVNALHPGIIDGPRMDKLCVEKAKVRGWTPEQVRQEYMDEMVLGRVTTAEDCADAVVFLASDASRNMTGQSMTVDGGWDV
jgi:NAD(P)-dependent dehydrogenase (short-subunit alcohol dehydrogenase family)